MSVKFGPSLNIVCGPNGVGKTTILDAIGSIFVANYPIETLRRRAGCREREIRYVAAVDGNLMEGVGKITSFNPGERMQPFGLPNQSKNVIYVKSNRDISYTQLAGLMRDPNKDEGGTQTEVVNGISTTDVKQWFSNRHLMSPHGKNWPAHRLQNYQTATRIFSILDATVVLDHVDSSSFDIMLRTPSGVIPFEYMSAGFRTAYGLILGILEEIEFRKLDISAGEFGGLILVDELDLHLHPSWHGPMLDAIVQAYPAAQIVVTTHSPHMIQTARSDSIIILPRDGHEQ